MNKKIVVGSVLAVFVLVAISLTSVIGGIDGSENSSPLYVIRTEQANEQETTFSDSADYIGVGMETVSVLDMDADQEAEQENYPSVWPSNTCLGQRTYCPLGTCKLLCRIFITSAPAEAEVEYRDLI